MFFSRLVWSIALGKGTSLSLSNATRNGFSESGPIKERFSHGTVFRMHHEPVSVFAFQLSDGRGVFKEMVLRAVGTLSLYLIHQIRTDGPDLDKTFERPIIGFVDQQEGPHVSECQIIFHQKSEQIRRQPL